MNMTLRGWELSDAADLAKALNNKNIQDNLRDGIPFPYNLRDAEVFITSMLSAKKDSLYAWAITADGKAIGSIGVFRKENIHSRTAEMGYYVAEPFWGKGACTFAAREACDYVFRNTDILRIFADPFAYNAASCQVLEKAGFQFEGILRKNAVKNGKVLDMNMYARVKETDG
ncbi:putative ribosomal N-acetyltransferase YdaF [bioreactor metagenome]|uniref:Putative ribosomal N-acetyltransferase YdaF n=1 Tax=bioreactor metagenome TaxID=1076179 RepID=A0A645AMA6_9ZZZZ